MFAQLLCSKADDQKFCEVGTVLSFDMQKIKNPDIQGTDYQQGDQLGFWNIREYVLFRDGRTCQHCKGKSKDPILNVHHLESRKTGGDSPKNLITSARPATKFIKKVSSN